MAKDLWVRVMAGEVHMAVNGRVIALTREQAVDFANLLIAELKLPEPYIARPWFGRRWADALRVWWAYRTGALTKQQPRLQSIVSPPK